MFGVVLEYMNNFHCNILGFNSCEPLLLVVGIDQLGCIILAYVVYIRMGWRFYKKFGTDMKLKGKAPFSTL